MPNIKLRVKNLVNKYRTGDPFQLAGDLGIKIVRLPPPRRYTGISGKRTATKIYCIE